MPLTGEPQLQDYGLSDAQAGGFSPYFNPKVTVALGRLTALDLLLTTGDVNFCRQHKTLKGSTPAMAAGIVKHLWSVKDLLHAATKF